MSFSPWNTNLFDDTGSGSQVSTLIALLIHVVDKVIV